MNIRKISLILIAMLLLSVITGCAKSDKSKNGALDSDKDNTDTAADEKGSSIDVDLTKLSSTMVYSEVYNMMTDPDTYKGKVIKMYGKFSYYHDDTTNKNYYSCIVKDATACCSQGIEFELERQAVYPDDYPHFDSDFTIIGTFDTYDENGSTYCVLRKAKIL